MAGIEFPDLRAFIERLRRDGDLAVVDAPVPSDLDRETPYDQLITELAGQLGRIESPTLERAVRRCGIDTSFLRGEAWKERFADLLARIGLPR